MDLASLFYEHILVKNLTRKLYILNTQPTYLPHTSILSSDAGTGGPGGPPQYLEDQLTLIGILSPPITTAPPIFFTFRHHC